MRTFILSAGAAAALLVTGACSSSGTDASSGTTAAQQATSSSAAPSGTTKASGSTGSTADAELTAYCQELQQTIDGDPGIDAIFENNPEPSLADWAAFLPAPIAKLQGWVDALEGITPPADMAEAHAQVIQNMSTVVANFEASQQSAAAGDQAAFDAAEAKNQDVDLPAMQASMAPIGEACGFPS